LNASLLRLVYMFIVRILDFTFHIE
jgi:hypothetical protein